MKITNTFLKKKVHFKVITIKKKDRINEKFSAINFPHSLDRRNVSNKADVPLPSCWYSNK